jgi:competence protein ComEA
LSRPEPARGIADRARDWIGWFGLGRLVASAVAVVIVCGGAYWLIRTPPPPTEASLPRVTAPAADSGTAPTLPPPAPGAVPESEDRAEVTVHVAGAVVAPGVYELPAGARIHAAVEAAGGTTSEADPDALNLAAVVADGSRVYVPAVGEVVAPPASADNVAAADAEPTGPLDVNRATASELDTLPGVGPATATAIVAERERNGPFLSVDDLDRVPGIGPAKLSALRDLVTV